MSALLLGAGVHGWAAAGRQYALQLSALPTGERVAPETCGTRHVYSSSSVVAHSVETVAAAGTPHTASQLAPRLCCIPALNH